MEGDSGRDSSLLAAHREEGVAEGWASSHPGHPEVGVLKAEHPADGTVRDHPRRSRHQLPSPMGQDREYSQRLHLGLDRQSFHHLTGHYQPGYFIWFGCPWSSARSRRLQDASVAWATLKIAHF